jgi:hypothetical protein
MEQAIEKRYQSTTNTYPKKVGLFCNARNEKNMKEWAAHHLLLGFDIVVIFDHKSVIPLSSEFQNFDPRVVIIRIDIETQNTKLHLMDKAINIAKTLLMDWYIYMDADEFLILNKIGKIKIKNIKHFLSAYSYADSIGINWLMFGSNYFVNDPPQGLIIENYNRSSLMLDKHVKSFVRTNRVDTVGYTPHFYNMIKPAKTLGLDFKYMPPSDSFNYLNLPFHKAPAYIAHYVYQSEETYLRRKISMKADDGTVRQNIGKEIHNSFNDGINSHPQKYVPRIKAFLAFWENRGKK